MKSLFIGRFQVPGGIHDGHKALFETVLKEGKSIVIAIRDTEVDKDNPFLAVDRLVMIKEAMKSWGDKVEVITIPDVTEVCYGRDVGWGIREIHLPEELEAVSASDIRKEKLGPGQKVRQEVHDAKWIQTPPKKDFHTFVFYHGGCLDGFGAATVAHKALGDQNVTYIPCTYSEEEVDPLKRAFALAKEEVFPNRVSAVMVDFTYPRDVLLSIKNRVKEFTVLDHHRSAEKDLEGLDFCIFDMKKSGAMLAWEYWFPHETPPKLIEYIQDRDLWLFNLPGSEEISAALRSQIMTFEVWDALIDDGLEAIEDLKRDGSIILTHQNQMVDIMCEKITWMTIGGQHMIPVVNASVYFSEVGNRLCKMFPDAAFTGFFYDTLEIRQFGLRSSEKGMDVSEIAKMYGGGGHVHAAGFIIPTKKMIGLRSITKNGKKYGRITYSTEDVQDAPG